jgi:hypothetical protein
MADIVITAANCKKTSGTQLEKSYVAGEALTAGKVCYLKSTDGKIYKAQADGTAEEATFKGIALNDAGADQPVILATGGSLTIGGTVVVGTVYAISAAAGGIAPWADLVTTNKVTIVGYGISATLLQIAPVETGVAIP